MRLYIILYIIKNILMSRMHTYWTLQSTWPVGKGSAGAKEDLDGHSPGQKSACSSRGHRNSSVCSVGETQAHSGLIT